MLLNVGKAIQSIEDCLKALNLLLMIQLEINDGHEHSAVKLIDELQGKGALRAIEDVPFYKKILKSLETSKKKVWNSATGQVKRWLSSVRDESIVMGSLALSQLQTRFEQFQRQQPSTRPFELFLSEVAPEDSEIITSNDLVKVDFTPLQSSLRLFTMMDRRLELIDLLIDTRRVQLDLILSARVSLENPDTDPKSLRSFLNSLTGYFIFERLLTRLPISIYPLSHLESHWEVTQQRIREIALDSLRLSSSDRAAFMKIKWQLVFFTHVLEMFGFPKTQLIESILTLFYRYVDLLRQEAIEKCSSSIERDTFTEGHIDNNQFGNKINILPSLNDNLNSSSICLFECVQIIKNGFLQSFQVFLEGVPGCSNRSVDFSELARKTVDDQILPNCARKLVQRVTQIVSENDAKSSSSSAPQLVRILKCLSDFGSICSLNGDLTKVLLYFPKTVPFESKSSEFKLNSCLIFNQNLKIAYEKVVDLIKEDLVTVLGKLCYDRNPKIMFNSPSSPIQGM